MGAIVAVFNKNKNTATKETIQALKTLQHRGKDMHGIATHNQVQLAKKINELETKQFETHIALGYNFARIIPEDTPQPVLTQKFALAFEGRLHAQKTKNSLEKFKTYLGENYKENAVKATATLDGAFSFAIANNKEIIAGRDPMGTIPLYYGENQNICAVASEKKALWNIGILNAKSFPPGNVAVINEKGFTFRAAKTLTQQQTTSLTIEKAAEKLQALLLHSCRKRLGDTEKVAVAFSGGLDSSLIALCAKLCNIKVHLLTVGLEEKEEISHARKAASALELPITIKTYTLNDVEKILSPVLWLIEEAETTQLAIAIPLYWTAQLASQLGFHVLLAGQGSDELFGGYHKYLTEYAKCGFEGLQKAMWKDIASLHEKNFERDNKVCAYHNVELRLPFADFELATFAVSLPPEMKITSKDDTLRKRILRTAAINLGMPAFIANRRKKAIQYATGVNNALKKIASKKGLTIKGYVQNCFQKIYPTLEEKT